MACFGFRVKERNIYPFTSFVLRVNTVGGWEKTVAKVLKKTKEIANFRLYGDGMVQVSGTVDPELLLKVMGKSGKQVQIVAWKFGGCSRNLHMSEYQPYLAATYNNYYRHGGGYGGGGGGNCGQCNHLHSNRVFQRLSYGHPAATSCHHHWLAM